MKSRLMGAACAAAMLPVAFMSEAALHGRLPATPGGTDYQAYYDDVLNITWLADANYAQSSGFDADGLMGWADANLWAAGLDIEGVTGWRLPGVGPIDGVSFDPGPSSDASTDVGFADSDGWVDGGDIPVSEMGHLYYVTLGNLGFCDPAVPWCVGQPGWGLDNTGPFENIDDSGSFYWSSTAFDFGSAFVFGFGGGLQSVNLKGDLNHAWAVHDGDVSVAGAVVPIPPAIWMFLSGVVAMTGLARRGHA